MTIEVKNAIITDAQITNDDHGLLSAWLSLDYGSTAQGFGGYCLYSPVQKNQPNAAGLFLWRVLEVAGVTNWSELPGKTIRVRCEWEKIHAIGHIIKDDWFSPADEFALLRQLGDQLQPIEIT